MGRKFSACYCILNKGKINKRGISAVALSAGYGIEAQDGLLFFDLLYLKRYGAGCKPAPAKISTKN
jgi:hypothetical protein